MKVLVVGGGGREHTLVWKIAQNPEVKKIYCTPGNAGISELAECISIKAGDIIKLLNFALAKKIDLTVVGPETPLACGIADAFEMQGLRIFGPTQEAIQLEASKIFGKKLMRKYGIPTGECEIFRDYQEALSYIQSQKLPIVIKADGLAEGKGVIIAKTRKAAEEAIRRIMVDKVFGQAGNRVIVEEYLEGPEFSMIAFIDGKTVLSMEPAQDHKAVFDEDKGPNTGGMGAYSPVPIVTPDIWQKADDIIKKTIQAMQSEGIPYKGVLYGGMMLTRQGIKVLEFNCRFGDPETQAVIPRLRSDLVEIMEAVIDERLDEIKLQWSNKKCISVVLASGGYPGSYECDKPITNLEKFQGRSDLMVFHAGTKLENNIILTSGGRVLGVTALGNSFKEAIEKAYRAVDLIEFQDKQYRTDIGKRVLTQ